MMAPGMRKAIRTVEHQVRMEVEGLQLAGDCLRVPCVNGAVSSGIATANDIIDRHKGKSAITAFASTTAPGAWPDNAGNFRFEQNEGYVCASGHFLFGIHARSESASKSLVKGCAAEWHSGAVDDKAPYHL